MGGNNPECSMVSGSAIFPYAYTGKKKVRLSDLNQIFKVGLFSCHFSISEILCFNQSFFKIFLLIVIGVGGDLIPQLILQVTPNKGTGNKILDAIPIMWLMSDFLYKPP